MSRDPFEHLRAANPLPDDTPVHAPMSTAERITGAAPRRTWPAWALAGGLALAVLVGGGSWLLWLRGGTEDVVATSTAPPTTAAVTTTPWLTTPFAIYDFTDNHAVVYFFVEDDGTQIAPGPYLIPVARPYSVLSHIVEDPVHETLRFLLTGPYPGEREAGPALISEIPAGSELLGVQVASGIADVDLSTQFFASGDGPGLRGRLAQVVYTLTRFPEIKGVRFWSGGQIVGFDETVGVSYPVVRADFARPEFPDLLPPILIESPVYGATDGKNPLPVKVTFGAFEGGLGIQLLDQHGAVLYEQPETVVVGAADEMNTALPYEVAQAQLGTLVFWGASLEDGIRLYERRHPVWLSATPGLTTTTSIDPVAALLAERYDLDKALDTYLEELAAIDAQLAGLPLDQGTELRTRAAEIDQQVGEVRDGLSPVYDGLRALGAAVPLPCSADQLGSELEGQPGLPATVAALRYQVYEAARSCDWVQIAGLLDPDDFSYSFDEEGDPITYWQRMEFLHYEPMLYIAGMLAAPYGLMPDAAQPAFAWPSAHTYASWTAVPEAEKEALRPLYGDLDFDFFEEFGGYLGYRVGITLNGDGARWIYAITGD